MDAPPRIVLSLTLGLIAPAVAAAQESRTRALSYDVEKRQWVEEAAPTPGTPQARLQGIRDLIAAGGHKRALAAIDRVTRDLGETHAVHPDLLIAAAEAHVGLRRFDKAHRTLQEFLNRYSGMPQTAEALRLEFVIAEAYLQGAKRRWLGMPMLSGTDEAIQILDEISTNHPDSPLAELAIKATADHMFQAGDHRLAESEYARLLQAYPRSRYAEHALRRSAEAALASYGGVEYDEAQLIEAGERFEEFRRFRPAAADREGVGAILESIRESRAEKDLSIAAYYDRTKHFPSAIYYYRLVTHRWPGTIAAGKATERLRLLGATLEEVRTGAGG